MVIFLAPIIILQGVRAGIQLSDKGTLNGLSTGIIGLWVGASMYALGTLDDLQLSFNLEDCGTNHGN